MCNKTQYSVNIRIGHVEISVEGYFVSCVVLCTRNPRRLHLFTESCFDIMMSYYGL